MPVPILSLPSYPSHATRYIVPIPSFPSHPVDAHQVEGWHHGWLCTRVMRGRRHRRPRLCPQEGLRRALTTAGCSAVPVSIGGVFVTPEGLVLPSEEQTALLR